MAQPSSKTTTILSGQSLTGVLDLGIQRMHAVIVPTGWTTAGITFQVSADGITFVDLWSETAEYALASTVTTAGRAVWVNNTIVAGFRYIKIRSGTSGSPVSQGADRIVTFITVPAH